MTTTFTRRRVLKAVPAAAAAATLPAPFISGAARAAGDPILIGVPTAQTAQAGVADHQDYLNGTTLAIEEINAAGGVLGRPLKTVVVDIDPLSPESGQVAINKLIDAKVHAMSCAFVFTPVPVADVSARYKAPFLWGLTQRNFTDILAKSPEKYGHIFQTDPSEVHYGYTFPVFLKAMRDQGVWKPINNGVHIVQEQIAYNQTISKALQSALPKSEFKLAGITDIQYPVQDWGSVIQEIKKVGAGAVMIDHWVAAEYAAFVKQFGADPLKGALVYLQYGPSQPEFLELSGPAAEGFVWSTVLGVYADDKGKEFRAKYKKRFPGIMGLCYTGNGYDVTYYLKAAWEAVGDPNKFREVCDFVRKTPYRGVCGYMSMNNPLQECAHYPDTGDAIGAKELEQGMAQLFFQVQNAEHRIIYPDVLKETALRKAPWW
ncbi:ABC transporter substrate-binding protein [Bradyrhizobium manausense]|uniref:ABC transporter substrate-binding protein n=1 Tax=Bradyrhizobium TaxID=374 RepID=UPI001BACB0BD|nr:MULTISPECIES: ABC transporter substrate-binding protein [Bradyrhizobium]MBR0830129.1 ABC transporter substrate-binding protein [Bradyrhizobium manausense]UVO30898.1 ABC transporter substrate-binding protein [Bradyrhizobium arachidis]